MFGVYIEQVEKRLKAVIAHLQTSEIFRAMIAEAAGATPPAGVLDLSRFSNPPDPTEWRVIDHAAALSRTYAIYEQFVHELMRELVTFLESSGPFQNLDAKFQTAYRHGFSFVSQKIDYARYSHLALPNIVASYADALSGKVPYSLLSEALLTLDKNLAMNELSQLFTPCGIDNMGGFIDSHPAMIAFFAAEQRLAADAGSELKRFIQDRNEAAHGGLTISQILGQDELVEYVDFCTVLCLCIAERVQKAVLSKSIEVGKAELLCESNEVYKKGLVVIASVNGTISNGMELYAIGGGRCYEIAVKSIQLDNEDIDGVTTTAGPLEVGFGLNLPVRKGYKIVRRVPAVQVTEVELPEASQASLEAVSSE